MRLVRLTAWAVLTFAVLAAPRAAVAQQVGKVYRIGFLRNGPPPETFMGVSFAKTASDSLGERPCASDTPKPTGRR